MTDPYGGHYPYRPRSYKRIIGLNPTTQSNSTDDISRDRSSMGCSRIFFVSKKFITTFNIFSTYNMWFCIILPEDGICQAKLDTTTGRNMWEMYQLTFKLPSIRARDVCGLYPVAAQIITPGTEPLYRYGMQTLDVLFLGYSRQSEYCMQNKSSSEKTKYCHSCIQFCLSIYLSRRLSVLLREAEIMITELTSHFAANIRVPYEWNLGVLQMCSFP